MGNMNSVQRSLFEDPPRLPEGFRYEENLLSLDQERALIASFKCLPFREFEYRGFLGKRRTVSFGWRYDFNVRELQETEHIPTFLLPLRRTAAKFANVSEDRLQHALVTEYAPGAPIGWHRDRPEFEDVIGISFGGAVPFPVSSQKGDTLGAFVNRTPAPLRISPSWISSDGLATQYPAS
jgi:alkylated DNA repair dioxygenase AlkB